LSGHSEAVTFLNFRSEGYLLASGDKSGKTLIWDTETYELEKVLYEHDDKIIDIAFSNFGYFC
jgi:WD40 repeat protein